MTLQRCGTRLARVLLLPLIALILSGCWDHVEINRRLFVIGVGIDLPERDDMGKEPTAGAQNRPAKFRMSSEVVLWRGASQSTGGGNSFLPSLTKPAAVITGSGPTLFDIEAYYGSRTSREVYWSHLKTIFIGEDFAREVGLMPIIDFFTRDGEFNRRMRIGVTQGEALPFIQATVVGDPFVGDHVASMFDHAPYIVRAPDVDFNQVDASMRGRGNILLPRFTLGNGEIAVAGSAVIKHGKMIGWLGETESIWALFVLNHLRGGTILVPDPERPSENVLFGVNNTRTNISLDQEPGKISFKLEVQVEGRILERVAFDASPSDAQWMGKVEKAVAEAIETGVAGVLDLMQHTYQADVFGFDDYLHKHRPSLWKQLEKDWDDAGFGTLEFKTESSVKVRSHGDIH